MAKISRYEQNQLQSELVGTPGVDTSTAQLFNVAAQGFGDVATQMRYVAAQKQREVAAATKAQQRALDEVQVATETAKLMPEILAQQDNIKSTTPPEQWGQMFNQNMPVMLDKINQADYSPGVKLGLQKAVAGIYKSETDQLHSAGITQRTENSKVDIANSYDALVASAGQQTAIDGISKLWAQADALVPKAALVYGDAKAQELALKAKEGMAKEYLYAATVKSPEAVQSIIDSKAFESVLSEQDKENFIFKAHSLVRAKEAQIKQDDKTSADVNQIGQYIIDANTDEKDPTAVTQRIIDIDRTIAATPKTATNKGLLEHLASQKEHLTKVLDDAPKKADAEAKKAKQETYNSESAAAARTAMADDIGKLHADMGDSKKWDRDDAAKVVERVQKLYARSKKLVAQGYYSGNDDKSLHAQFAKKLAEANNRLSKKMNPAEQLAAAWKGGIKQATDALGGALQQVQAWGDHALHANDVRAKGAKQYSKPKDIDTFNQTFNRLMDKQIENHHRAHGGAEPNAAAMRLMVQRANEAAHGAVPSVAKTTQGTLAKKAK